MKKEFGARAIKLFEEMDRLENRIISKAEFDLAYYGRKLRRGESNYYYQVKRKYLEGREA